MWNPSVIDGPVPVPLYGPEETQEDGTTIRPVIGYRDGYHLNVAPSLLTHETAPFGISPKTPDRTFAGAETVFLRFVSEAKARQVLAEYWIEPEPEATEP